MSRVHHLRRLVAVAVLLLVTVLGVSSASGAPGAATPTKSARAAAAAAAVEPGQVDPKYGIRGPIFDLDGNFNAPETVYDAVQAGTTADVARSKTTITLPPSVILTYIRACGKLQSFDENGKSYFVQYCCPDGVNTAGCNPALIVKTPATNRDNAPQVPGSDSSVAWTRVTGPIYAASPPGSARPYGIFPKVKVQLLAFGSLPATATVQLSQPVTAGGAVTPLQYFDLTLAATPEGTVVQGFPGVKEPTSILVADRFLRGKVDVRLTDVRVDGRALDVGDRCEAKGAALNYTAPRGERASGAIAPELAGRPGEFDALDATNPGTAGAAITIPAFQGCRDGSRRLDSLISALASGKSRVGLTLRTGAAGCDAEFNPIKGCPAFPGYEGPVATQPTALSRALATLPSRTAKNLVASLPDAVRREVPAKYRR